MKVYLEGGSAHGSEEEFEDVPQAIEVVRERGNVSQFECYIRTGRSFAGLRVFALDSVANAATTAQ